jgi:hypothetical protein
MFKPKCYKYGCRLTAYSYVTGLSEETLVARIGHDGSEIVRKAKEPFNHRAFHPQELIDALLPEWCIVEIHALPMSDSWPLYNQEEAKERFNSYTTLYNGVLEGWTKGGNFHALAVIGGTTIDPDTGREFDITGFTPTEFYMVFKVLKC